MLKLILFRDSALFKKRSGKIQLPATVEGGVGVTHIAFNITSCLGNVRDGDHYFQRQIGYDQTVVCDPTLTVARNGLDNVRILYTAGDKHKSIDEDYFRNKNCAFLDVAVKFEVAMEATKPAQQPSMSVLFPPHAKYSDIKKSYYEILNSGGTLPSNWKLELVSAATRESTAKALKECELIQKKIVGAPEAVKVSKEAAVPSAE